LEFGFVSIPDPTAPKAAAPIGDFRCCRHKRLR
jgi:hypothetical protein